MRVWNVAFLKALKANKILERGDGGEGGLSNGLYQAVEGYV